MDMALTVVSEAEYDQILYGNMTPDMAAEYLRSGHISARSFSETLRSMYPKPDLMDRLLQFFSLIEPNANIRSQTKKLQNWLNGRNQPSNRDDLFRIAFALQLSEDQLNYLLGLTTDYCIQYRDGRDLILAWFLRNGYGYGEAVEFYASLPDYQPTEVLGPEMHSHITRQMQNTFATIYTLEELRNCYLMNLHCFGTQHLRAYFYFERYLALLMHPSSVDGGQEQDYSIDTVMNTYLAMHMPSGRKRTNYSLVQKLIKQNWPNATSLKNIRNHAEDVPRKLLLLLYVVTENCGYDDLYQEIDEEYITLEDRVQDHWWTLNAMLSDCGMAQLDLRNAFDWLILYAIAADPDEIMSERLEQVIAGLYDFTD